MITAVTSTQPCAKKEINSPDVFRYVPSLVLHSWNPDTLKVSELPFFVAKLSIFVSKLFQHPTSLSRPLHVFPLHTLSPTEQILFFLLHPILYLDSTWYQFFCHLDISLPQISDLFIQGTHINTVFLRKPMHTIHRQFQPRSANDSICYWRCLDSASFDIFQRLFEIWVC